MSLALLLLCTLVPASGQEAPPTEDLGEAAARIRQVVRSPAPSARTLEEAFAALHEEVTARTSPVSDEAWVPVLLDLTVARFQLGQDWRAPRTAAAWARPDLPVPVGPSLATLRDWTPPPPADSPPLPHGRSVWLDGRPRDTLPALSGLHLVQGVRCGAWRSELVEGPSARQVRGAWYADCPAPPWSSGHTALVAGGATLMAVGLATSLTTFLLAQGSADDIPTTLGGEPLTRGQKSALRGLNAGGWSAMGVGVAMVVPGTVLQARHVRRQRARR